MNYLYSINSNSHKPETQAQNIQGREPTSARIARRFPGPTGDFQPENDLGEIEGDVIIKALEKTRYNKTAAAQLLGISFRALRYRLKKLGLE